MIGKFFLRFTKLRDAQFLYKVTIVTYTTLQRVQ